MKPQAYIFIGRSGSGKGTQAKLLIDHFEKTEGMKAIHVETGKLLRNFTKSSDTLSSKLTKDVMGNGHLMPTFIPIWLWAGQLVNNFTGVEHLVFDGLPRRMREVKILETAIEFYDLDRAHVVYVDISKEEAKKRLLARKRSDDTEEDIENRLRWFETDVLPIIEYYKITPGRDLHTVDGECSIEEVHEKILKAIGSHA